MPSQIKAFRLAFIDEDFQHQAPQRIHHLFVRQVSIRPESTALVYNGQAWCYRDLEEHSNQLARHLRGRGVRAGTLVAICLDRTPELIITILAVMKAGGAYVPLDPAYPAERIAMMLADCLPPLLVTHSSLCITPDFSGWRLALDVEAGMISAWSATPLDESANNIDLACIFYTSGSTGRPKGAVSRGVV